MRTISRLFTAILLASSIRPAVAAEPFELDSLSAQEIASRNIPEVPVPVLFPADPGTAAEAPYGEPPAADRAQAALSGFQDNATDRPAFELLKQARTSIDIEIYEISDPDIRAILRAAINRKPKPVRVRIIREPSPVGERCHYFDPVSPEDDEDCRDQKKLVSEIRSSEGGAYVPFNKETLCGDGDGMKNCYEHGKLVIVDKKRAMISSGNLNSSNLCNLQQNPRVCNRDFSYVISDAGLVRVLSAIFEKDLKGESYDLQSILASAPEHKLTVSPYSREPLLSFIGKARKSIRIENQYLKEPAINEALKQKAREGVKVQLMMSSLCSFGLPDVTPALLELYRAFDAAGIKVRMFTAGMKVGGRAGYLHSKAIVIDDTHAWIGSINGSVTAVDENREYGVFFDEAAGVSRLKDIMDADYSDPASETWRESLRCRKDQPISPSGMDPQ